jgi:NAD(P)-dependent dehydrogenase (short-subunit alcohol dehydrogenase family)
VAVPRRSHRPQTPKPDPVRLPFGCSEELAGAATFLASSASDFENGQILYVDGGLLAALWGTRE